MNRLGTEAIHERRLNTDPNCKNFGEIHIHKV